jgi:hypothetical protein
MIDISYVKAECDKSIRKAAFETWRDYCLNHPNNKRALSKLSMAIENYFLQK